MMPISPRHRVRALFSFCSEPVERKHTTKRNARGCAIVRAGISEEHPMFDKDGKLDARSQRILAEQTIPPRFGLSLGMQALGITARTKPSDILDEIERAAQSLPADKRNDLDAIVQAIEDDED